MLEHSAPAENADIDWRELASHFFSDAHPMFSQFNVDIKDISALGVEMEASLGPNFKTDPDNQHLHRGALTLLLDSAFGIALFAHIKELRPIATINLKTDYLLPAKSEATLLCRASCFSLDGDVARMQGNISDPSTQTVLAKATAAFMIGTQGPNFSTSRSL